MSSNDLAPLGCVFDGDNIQRDDEVAPDSFNDIDAVAFCLSYKGDVSTGTIRPTLSSSRGTFSTA